MTGARGVGRGALAAVVGGVVIAAAGGGLAYQRSAALARARERAQTAERELADGIDALKRDLVAHAEKAVRVPELHAAVENRVDEATFLDLFRNEDWWAAHREYASAVVVDRKVQASLGIEPAAASAVAGQGRAPRAVGAGSGPPVLLTAETRSLPRSGRELVVVLGRPLDTTSLERLLTPSLVAVVISDGRRARTWAGQEQATLIAGRFIGREADRISVDASGEWSAAATPVGDRLWAIGFAAPGGAASPAGAVWGALAGGLSLLGLGLFGLVRSRSATRAPALLPAPGSSPAGSLSPVPSLSPRLVSPGSLSSTGVSPPAGPAGAAAATALAAEATQQFGRYTLLERIGQGGMADVFKAVLSGAEGFERLVVIKRLRPHLALNPEAVAQFIDEAKLGSVLTHSNIVTVSDFGKLGDGYFLAAEYVAGRTLAEISGEHSARFGRPIPTAFVFCIAHEVLSALAYAHERTDGEGRPLEIVHRDVSPSNIMVNFEGEVKLLDFGIVKAADRVARTREGNVKGNVGYMSPEQARGLEVSARSDLFSLGVVMFDLLAGAPFYSGGGAGEIFYQSATGPTAEHLARINQFPPPVAEVLRRVLSLDPAGRYPSARAFAQALGGSLTVGKGQLAEMMRVLFPRSRERK